MPPRKSMAKRKKQSSTSPSVKVDDQLKTTSDSNNKNDDPVENNDVQTVTELKSVQGETTTVQVDVSKIISENYISLVVKDHDDEEVEEIAQIDEVEEIAETVSAQQSNVSKSPCNDNDAIAVEDVGNGDIKDAIAVEDVGNGDIKEALETVAVNESGEAVTALISSENETPLAVEDESKENVDDDNEKNDDIAGDNVDNKGDEDTSLIDNKIDKNIEIYVGKLDKDTVEDDLVKVFQQFGELESTRIVRNQDTKKSKGFAFVRFASADQAMRALSELKDGVEVRGKLVNVSKSQNNKTLFLGNISKTWSKEEVVQQLAHYGIEHIETIRVPEDFTSIRKAKAGDTKSNKKIKGFAFLEFSTHSDAAEAFQRLKKPDVVFGRDISAKVSFEQSAKPSTDEDVPQVNRVHVAGLAKDWNEEKVKEICEKYGEIVKIDLHQSAKPKHKDFGFVTFSSRNSALACVEGINTTGTVGETKIIASIARAAKKQGLHGEAKNEKKKEVTKLNKEGEVSNKASDPKSIKMKGVLNSQQININGKDSSKNKIKAGMVKPQQKGLVKKQNSGEAVKGEKHSQPLKKDGESSKPKNKRKAPSEKKAIAPPDLRQGGRGNSKRPKKGGEGQNSKTNPKAGNNKRKKAPAYEGREDRDNRNSHGKNPLKKHKGSMHTRERENYRNPQSDARVIRGHDDYRNSTRYVDPYAPTYAASTSATYHLSSDSVSIRQRQEMEPHAGYIQPAAKHSQSYSGYIQPAAKHSQSYSGYIQPAVRQHQPVYLEPASTSQSYSRYLDHPVMTQSHRRYIESPAVSEVQPYRGYRPSEIVQIAHDPYDPGLTRVVREDNRGSGVLSYIGGPSLPASHVANPTSYYQSGSTYSGAYGIGRRYY